MYYHHKLLLVHNTSKLQVLRLVLKNVVRKLLLLLIQVTVVLHKVISTKESTLQVHIKLRQSLLFKTTNSQFQHLVRSKLQVKTIAQKAVAAGIPGILS